MSGAGDSETPSVSASRKVRPADRKIRRRVERGDHRLDQCGLVGRVNAETVADHVIEPAFGQIEFDMPGFLFRAFFVEATAREESGGDRIVARAAGRGNRRGHGLRLRRRRRSAELGIEILQHAGGVLAARHAQVQPLFLFGEQRIGVVLAVITALTAILLRHRRHHAARQRLAVGELHAVGERHRRVVPGRAVVFFRGRDDPGQELRQPRRSSAASRSPRARSCRRTGRSTTCAAPA